MSSTQSRLLVRRMEQRMNDIEEKHAELQQRHNTLMREHNTLMELLRVQDGPDRITLLLQEINRRLLSPAADPTTDK